MTSALLETTCDRVDGADAPPEVSPAAELMVLGPDAALARDYREHSQRSAGTPRDGEAPHPAEPVRIVVFVKSRIDRELRSALHQVGRILQERPVVSMTLVHTCAGLLGDRRADEVELLFRETAHAASCPLRVVRCGPVLSAGSAVTSWVRRLSWLHPLLGERPATAFVPAEMLFAAIDGAAKIHESEAVDDAVGDRTPGRPHGRTTWTLLGPRRAWRDLLRKQPRNAVQTALTGLSHLLSWLMVSWLLRVCLTIAMRWWPRLRIADVQEIRPESAADLVSLVNRWTSPHVQVAGYNNGVNHFGWRFPEKTVVVTTRSGHLIRAHGDTMTVDAGVTLKRCLEALRRENRDLIVAPNFSYVAAGTAFFVPIHGSGCEVSTLGDTIESVLLYDPRSERFVRARRGEPAFAAAMYNRATPLLLLRLTLRTRESARYFVARETLAQPTAETLIEILTDRRAANVEIRKHRAADQDVDVTRYSTSPAFDGENSTEVPRDRIGRLWDRLEENRLTAWLFHTFVRTCAYHVELFMTPDEFRVFWEAHRALPLSKIQLRCVRKDGMPHSPMRAHDLISADLFLMRRHRAKFLTFVREALPHVRFNPGKQSL